MKSNGISVNTILYLFIGIWLTSVIGFHHNYTSKFPDFEGVSSLWHFHGNVMMAWYVLLFAQVLLIKFDKKSWHRTLGLLGFVVAPMVVYTTLLVTKDQYYRELPKQGETGILGHFTVEIPLMILFSLPPSLFWQWSIVKTLMHTSGTSFLPHWYLLVLAWVGLLFLWQVYTHFSVWRLCF
jgi:hypothetical protein